MNGANAGLRMLRMQMVKLIYELPFATKVGDEKPENWALWQPKIVYLTSLK